MLTMRSLPCLPPKLPHKAILVASHPGAASWRLECGEPMLWTERKGRRSAHGLLIPKLKSRGTSILKKCQNPGFPSLSKEISQVLRESRLGQSRSVQNEGQLLWWLLALSKWQFGFPTVPLSLPTRHKASRMEGTSKKSCLLLRLSPSCGRLQDSLSISNSRMGWKNSKLKKKM